jgi:hypothetical protein
VVSLVGRSGKDIWVINVITLGDLVSDAGRYWPSR